MFRLEEHFRPVPIIFEERFHFHWLNQEINKSIAAYIVELKHLSATCEFIFLEEALHDWFVCSLICEAT